MISLGKTVFIIAITIGVASGIVVVAHLTQGDITTFNIINGVTIAANIATVIALIFLGFEIRSSTKTRHLEGAIRLFDLLDDPIARRGRRAVYSAFCKKRELTTNEIEYAEKIRADFNDIGIMVRLGLFPKKIALKMYSDTTIRCWEALEEHIKKQRKDRGTPSFMEDFEWFYEESKKYRKKNYPQEKRKIFKQP